MRSFSWEIFVGAILLFFVAILVNNKSHQEEIRNRSKWENTHPSMLFEQSIAITVNKSMKAAKDAVEPISKAMAISISEVGEKETVSLVYEPQILKLKFE